MELEYEFAANFVTDEKETLDDCMWGSTMWDAYLILDGHRDRIQVSGALDATADETYGDNNEVQFWRFDGPDAVSVQQKSKELRLAAGASGQNRFWNHKAQLALWDNPQYWDASTSSFVNTTYNYAGPGIPSEDGYAHKLASPFTVTTTVRLFDNEDWENNRTFWSWGRYNHNNREGAGARLFQFSGLIHFFLGGGAHYRDHTTNHLSFIPSVPEEISEGRGVMHTASNTENAIFKSMGSRFNRMLENPNSGAWGTPQDRIKWYQLTVVYDGGPVGYVGSGNTGMTDEEMLSTINDQWHFYFTNMQSGKVVEADNV